MRTRLEETKIRLFAGASDFANADDGTVQELRGVIQVKYLFSQVPSQVIEMGTAYFSDSDYLQSCGVLGDRVPCHRQQR